MKTKTTLHVPMDRTVRDRLEERAVRLGFDSAQAYIRVWAQAEAEGRTLTFGDALGEPKPKVTLPRQRTAETTRRQNGAGKRRSFNSVDEYLAGRVDRHNS